MQALGLRVLLRQGGPEARALRRRLLDLRVERVLLAPALCDLAARGRDLRYDRSVKMKSLEATEMNSNHEN